MPVKSETEAKHQRYWEDFYSTSADRVPADPSPFAQWVNECEETPGPLVDVGTGTGRDALWFASQGFTTFGCDYSQAGVDYAAAHAREVGVDARFTQINVYDVDQMSRYARELCESEHPKVVYARFFVHALEDDGRHNLWRMSSEVLAHHEGRIYLEFRIQPTEHEFGEHYRQFVKPETVESELAEYGFEIVSSEQSDEFAVHKNERPLVARIVGRHKA